MVQVSAEGLNFSQLVRSLAALKSGLRWPCGSWGHKTIISTDLFTQHKLPFMKVAAGAFLHPCNSCFFIWNSTYVKIANNCSCKQTNINFNALNALFYGSHLVNDIDFSFEKSYVPLFLGYELSYDKVFVFSGVAPLSPHWDWSYLVDSLKVSTQYLPKYKMHRSTKFAKFHQVTWRCSWMSILVSFGELAFPASPLQRGPLGQQSKTLISYA